MLRALSRPGLAEVFDTIEARAEAGGHLPDAAWRALSMRRRHEGIIDAVVRFLQGRDRTLATRILDTPFLPIGPRLARADIEAFGPLSVEDAARAPRHAVHRGRGGSHRGVGGSGVRAGPLPAQPRGGVRCASPPLAARLEQTTPVDRWLDALTDSIDADVVGLSVPFPGTLYGALRIGRRLKARGVTVWMGGGYVNTELREVDEPALWSCVDALTYDDGEGPLLASSSTTAAGRTDGTAPAPPRASSAPTSRRSPSPRRRGTATCRWAATCRWWTR